MECSGSSLPPDWVYLQPTSFIGKIFSRSYEIGVALFQAGCPALDWSLEGVRFWKLSKTYPDEKQSSLSLPTKDEDLPYASLHNTCWQYTTSQWRSEPFTRFRWPAQSYLPRDYSDIFTNNKLFIVHKCKYDWQ